VQAQGIPMAIVTSKGQHRAQAQLEKLGWSAYFQTVIGKVDGRASKPNPEPLLLACQHMDVPVQRAMMLGDGEADMKAATRAGCIGVGLTHSFSEAELRVSGASICFASLSEFLKWLQQEEL